MFQFAQVAELVDALDSKSSSSNRVRVRFPPWAPNFLNNFMKKLPKLSLKMSKYFVFMLFMVVGVVFVWRGVWNLMEIYLLPNHPVLSSVVGIVIGLLILYLPDEDLKELI